MFGSKSVLFFGLILASVTVGAGQASAGVSYNTVSICVSPQSVALQGQTLSTGPTPSGQKFNWGTSNKYGNVAEAHQVGNTTSWNGTLSNLQPSTTYHYQFWGSPVKGSTTSEGGDMTFTTCGS